MMSLPRFSGRAPTWGVHENSVMYFQFVRWQWLIPSKQCSRLLPRGWTLEHGTARRSAGGRGHAHVQEK